MKYKINKKCVCGKNIYLNKKNSILLKKFPITEIFTNHFKKPKNSYLNQTVVFCNSCEHMFLKNHIAPEYIYNQNYGFSSTKVYSAIYSNEFFYQFINSKLKKSKIKKIVEVGSNDLYLLKKFYKQSRNLIGIDPVVKKDKKYKKIKIFKEFFDNVNNNKIGSDTDVIICGHTLEHVENPEIFLRKILSIAEKKTKIFFQFPSLECMVNNVSFDQIHHQHLNYFSINSFNKLLKKCGGKVIDYAYNEVHYGALMVYFTINGSEKKIYKKTHIRQKISLNHFRNSYDIFKNHLKLQEKTINNYLKKKKIFYVVAAGALLPVIDYHMNGIIKKADGILDDDNNKVGKYFANINTKIIKMKNADLKNSVCLVGCVASAFTTRKIVNILSQKKAEIIVLPTLTT